MKAAEYTSTEDYAVLTNRFKLLNLVQRVAHRDVLEMIETVGLDAISSKGTLERWQPGRTSLVQSVLETRTPQTGAHERRGGAKTSSPAARARTARASPTTITTTTVTRPRDPSGERLHFARGSSGQDAKIAAADPQRDAAVRPRRQRLRRTPSEEEAFYDRLAAPRERPDDVFIDHIEVMEAAGPMAGGARRNLPLQPPSQHRLHAVPRPRGYRTRDDDDFARAHLYRAPPGAVLARAPPGYLRTPPPLPHGGFWPGYAEAPLVGAAGAGDMYDDAGDDAYDNAYGYDSRGADPRGPPSRDGPADPPRESAARRVRFRDDASDPLHSADGDAQDAGTSPVLPDLADTAAYEGGSVLAPPRTDSEDSAPGAHHDTAPRRPPGPLPDDAATLDGPARSSLRRASSLSMVPPLPLGNLDSPSATGALTRTNTEDALSGVEDDSVGAPGMAATTGTMSGSGVARLQRAGGLRAKAKPRAALDSPRVPMEAIHHAASALLAQSNAARSQAAAHSPSISGASGLDARPDGSRSASQAEFGLSTPGAEMGSSSVALRSASQLLSASGFPPTASPVPVSLGVPTSRVPPAAFAQVSSTIDHMLLDHQRILDQLVRPDRGSAMNSSGERSELFAGDAANLDISFSRPRPQQVGRYTALSRDQQREIMQAHLLGDGSLDEDAYHERAACSGADDDVDEDDEVADEMLLYARLQRKVASMDADLARIEHAHAAEQRDEAQRRHASPDVAARPQAAEDAERRATAVAAARPASRRRAGAERGVMPEAVLRRLQAFRKENYEYIAYNEKLWNTSQVSQFAFAQRLTNALTEDCFTEVMAEVGDIMDDYVEGLADHELR